VCIHHAASLGLNNDKPISTLAIKVPLDLPLFTSLLVRG